MKQVKGADGADTVSWKGDDITYRTAHQRVQKARGRASDHQCVMCPNRAEHWAYDGQDPNEKWWYAENWHKEIPYSTDVTRYQPLCRGCHVKVDRYGRDLTPIEGR